MRAETEPFTEIFRERADIGACGTDHAHREIARAVLIFFQQFAVALNGFKRANRDAHRRALNLFAAPRQLIEFFSLNFFRRVHRRRLIDLAAQRLDCNFDIFSANALRLCVKIVFAYPPAGEITRVRRIAEANQRFVLLLSPAQELHQPRCFANHDD